MWVDLTLPIDDRRWKTRNLSSGIEIVLVDLARSELIEYQKFE